MTRGGLSTGAANRETNALIWIASRILFFGYVILLIAAGAWGIVGAHVDFSVLLGLRVEQMEPEAAANVLSQYRFLRAAELGFGLFSWRYRREIFTSRAENRLFLGVMAAGVTARLISVVVDGVPSLPMMAFLAWEGAGVVVIFAATRKVIRREEPGRAPVTHDH